MSKLLQKNPKKEVRKPISDKFAPKRLAISFDPPTIIMEYMVVDTGKLYHHKMRLDSMLKRGKTNRNDILNYIKNKHYLYFINGKVKDAQVLKFIDKILTRSGKNKSFLAQINENMPSVPQGKHEEEEDFDYLNEDEDYEEQYEDYEESTQKMTTNPLASKENQITAKTPAPVFTKQLAAKKEEEEKDDGAFEWDLEVDQDADFV